MAAPLASQVPQRALQNIADANARLLAVAEALTNVASRTTDPLAARFILTEVSTIAASVSAISAAINEAEMV
jgi:hypothetical protein